MLVGSISQRRNHILTPVQGKLYACAGASVESSGINFVSFYFRTNNLEKIQKPCQELPASAIEAYLVYISAKLRMDRDEARGIRLLTGQTPGVAKRGIKIAIIFL
jgi:hypothetical protein